MFERNANKRLESLFVFKMDINEFDSESREISNRITCSQTEREIAQIIAEVFNRAFGDSNEVERFMACAKKIYRDLYAK